MKWKLSTPHVEMNNVYSSTLEHIPSTTATVLKSLNKVMEAIKRARWTRKGSKSTYRGNFNGIWIEDFTQTCIFPSIINIIAYAKNVELLKVRTGDDPDVELLLPLSGFQHTGADIHSIM